MEKSSTFISWISHCSKSPIMTLDGSQQTLKKEIYSVVFLLVPSNINFISKDDAPILSYLKNLLYMPKWRILTHFRPIFQGWETFFWKILPETFPRFLYDFPWLLASILYDFPWLLASILYDFPWLLASILYDFPWLLTSILYHSSWLSWENIYICPWLKF